MHQSSRPALVADVGGGCGEYGVFCDVLGVIAVAPTFAEFVARAFDEIRLCAAGNVTILLHMLRAIERVAFDTRDAARRETLLLHARLVRDAGHQSVPASYDRARVDAALDHARETMRATYIELPALPALPANADTPAASGMR